MSTTQRILPKGVSEADFDAALGRFREIVGADSVLTEGAQLAPYTKIMMAGDDRDYIPSAAVLPASAEQVQEIVRTCNEFKVPIWTTSTAKNLGYGPAAPGGPGQVILDLHRRTRIPEW